MARAPSRTRRAGRGAVSDENAPVGAANYSLQVAALRGHRGEAVADAHSAGGDALCARADARSGLRLQWICRRTRNNLKLVLKSFQLVPLPADAPSNLGLSAPSRTSIASAVRRQLQQMPQLPSRALVTAIVPFPPPTEHRD